MLNILGINITTLNKKEILQKIVYFLSCKKKRYIVTANPEMLLHTLSDSSFAKILNQANLVIADGIGLKFASWLNGKNLTRFTGVDLVKYLLKIAQKNRLKIGIINWKKGLSAKIDICHALEKKYPNLSFTILDIDLPINKNIFLKKIPNKIAYCDILFVTTGTPLQEKIINTIFLHDFKNNFFAKTLAIGVGGSFDYLTGKARLAPKIMRMIGLEWLWRMCGILSKQKKNRKKRIYNAVIKFPIEVIKWKIKKNLKL